MNAGAEPNSTDCSQASPIDWASTLVRHDRWLRTVVAARLGERQAVDEVLQDVSLAAVSTKVTIDPARVAGWLYRLAIRKTLLYRRSRGRHHKLVDRYAAKVRDQGMDPPDPLGWLLLDERLALVRQAMERLASRDAEILLLKYTENWSCRDLAEHLGQTEGAIESRLHRAKQRLRDELARSSLIEVRP
jgi:RNA polymerase sigma factor (sigma-70 family)